MWHFRCERRQTKEAARSKDRKKPMRKFIMAALFLATQWQTAGAQVILGSIPEEFRGDWCWQEEGIFSSGACKLKAGSLSIDRMTLDTGRLSCVFDSGTASDDIVSIRIHCSDSEEKEPSMYGAQLRLRADKKIELTMEPIDQQ
jgi:hypothetical protein